MRFLKKLFLASVLCIATGCTAEQRAAYQAQTEAQQAQYNACTQDDRCRQERQFQQVLQAQQQAQWQAQHPVYQNIPPPAPLNGGGNTNTTNTVCTSYVPGTLQCQSN
jgi:cytochrome c-type biogenesis protein CcmH/NrfF